MTMQPWRPRGVDGQAFETDRDGIHCSRMAGPHYEEIPSSRMTRVLNDIPGQGVREVLRRHLAEGDLISEEYLFAPNRARFLERVNAPERTDSRALEIGSGYGPIARALAHRYAEVVAIEGSYERLRFARLWHHEEGLSKVVCVHAGVGDVDLGEGQFDLVVTNGSLEWIPYEQPDRSPRSTQLRTLSRVRSALRPDGVLYIGIENRFALFALAACPEPHTGIRFQSVVPRWAANLLARLLDGRGHGVPTVQRHGRYLNYTYSCPGYRQLLREAGFSSIEIAVPWPSYNRPDAILTDAAALISAYERHPLYRLAGYFGRILPAALWLLAPGYAIYARK
jgi:SAM-dependent methyltransferase